MAAAEADGPVINFYLVPELVNNSVGIYQPTPSFLEYVRQSVSVLKDAESAHRLFGTDPTRIARAGGPVAKNSNAYLPISIPTLHESTGNVVKAIWQNFRDTYAAIAS